LLFWSKKNLGTYFYWLGSIEGIFKSGNANQEGDISVFCRTKELEDTEAFFQRLMMYWDKLGSGYMRENLNLIDPISGRRIKTIKAELRVENNAAAVLAPLDITMGYHSLRGTTDEKSEDKGRACLRKGIDLRSILYFQGMMNVFNIFWSTKSNNPVFPHISSSIRTYQCIPLTKTFGSIEMLEPMVNIRNYNWANVTQLPEEVKQKFLASIAAAVTVSWIMGFRDKIEDFLFVHDFQIVISSIEKIHLWNAKPLDSDFLVRVKHLLNFLFPNTNGWNIFQQLCSETFCQLHEKGTYLTNICCTIYSGIYEKKIIEEFFTGNKGLMSIVPQQEALAHYMTALQDTGSFQKILKKVTLNKFKIK